ncbi:hypothetical protein FACS1894172_08340 [Spirochaetia bacterium]|nr:hypothetical protein FACS1894164_07940 [Spirochaetia bacterium]GHU32174.1 hypothetical protein FACS1894172_08340 [Spirochaetia bacterium]
MKRFRSEAMQVIYEDAEDMFKCGTITAEQLHELDGCLLPTGKKPGRTVAKQKKSTRQHRRIPGFSFVNY